MRQPGGEGQGGWGPVRVLLVSNVELHRDALAMRFALIGSITVVAVAAAGAQALRLASALRPDAAVIDVAAMPDPWHFTAALRASAPATRAFVVGASYLHMGAGAPPADPMTIVLALDTTFPQLVALIAGASELALGASGASGLASLTTRELEIVALIEQGLSNKQIADRLSIEVATVKNHVHNILTKLELSRRGEAAALLRRVLSGG
ncbi:MAG TPA: response regulator transcription factor [Solirubrobacteraceae bacterium]|nr:response regulator transcription factor [Solirubrobacteraceae bacterium]